MFDPLKEGTTKSQHPVTEIIPPRPAPTVHVSATFVGTKRKMWVVADFDGGRNFLYEHDDPTIVIRYAGFEEHVAVGVQQDEGGQLIETEAD